MSPSETSAPSSTSQSTMVPWVMVRPHLGILTMVAMETPELNDLANRLGNLLGARNVELLQRRAEGNRGVRRGDQLDGGVEQIESLVRDHGGDVGGGGAAWIVLIDDDQSVRLLDRGQDHVFIQRGEGARVDHLDLDSFAGECLCRGQRLINHAGDGHDGDVFAGAFDITLAEGDTLVAIR